MYPDKQLEASILAKRLRMPDLAGIGMVVVFRATVELHCLDGDLSEYSDEQVAYFAVFGDCPAGMREIFNALVQAKMVATDGVHKWVPGWVRNWTTEAARRRLSRRIAGRERVSIEEIEHGLAEEKPWLAQPARLEAVEVGAAGADV